jgi:hypothetical protein
MIFEKALHREAGTVEIEAVVAQGPELGTVEAERAAGRQGVHHPFEGCAGGLTHNTLRDCEIATRPKIETNKRAKS